MLSLSNASSHNAFYVAKDITTYYQDGSLWDRIAGSNGYDEFEGIFPGCYFDTNNIIKGKAIGTSSYAGNGGKTFLILGCNSLLHTGYKFNADPDYDLEKGLVYKLDVNHIVCCNMYFSIGNSIMNSDNTINNGYYNSFLNQQVIGLPTLTGNISGTINEQLYAEFGGHLKTYRQSLTIEFNNNGENRLASSTFTGASTISADENSWRTLKTVQAIPFSESELFGYSSLSSSGWENTTSGRFPAFMFDRHLTIFNWTPYWTRNMASTKLAVRVDGTGNLDTLPTTSRSDLRVFFVLG